MEEKIIDSSVLEFQGQRAKWEGGLAEWRQALTKLVMGGGRGGMGGGGGCQEIG